jgi:hypothetical protein
MPPRAFLTACLIPACAVTSSTKADPSAFVANYDEAKVPAYVLPDPLRGEGGVVIRNADTWRQRRRSELIDLFAREVYGRTPAGRPDALHWEVTSLDREALGGKAVRKEVTIWFTEGTGGPSMQLLIYQPAKVAHGNGPWPTFLGLNFFGNHCVTSEKGITLSKRWMREDKGHHIVESRASEASRGTEISQWNVEPVLERGYATATVYCGDICEDRAEGLTRDVGGLFHTNSVDARRPDEWGAIGIWAWGLSRAMDYIASDADLDATRVLLHGHSRLGKAALWAAAQDERFAVVISNESGCGGAALSKRIYGETVGSINSIFPYWFSKSFRAYNQNEQSLPVDQHELLALLAPRPLYVASAQGDRWADPRGEFLSLKHAEPVYALFGKKGLGTDQMPPVDQPVFGDGVAYHIRTGKHDITPYDWAQYLAFADRALRKR